MSAEPRQHGPSFHGPLCWVVTAVAGAVCGAGVARVLPGAHAVFGPDVRLWLVVPFALLLASIALMPFVNARFWHLHYPDFAFALGGFVAGYYLTGFGPPPADGHHAGAFLVHALKEYYAFIALVGGLFIVSGGILVDTRGPGTPLSNTFLLAAGAVLANLVGTTGASMLLIRPFMRINRGRLRPMHIVFFIFLVSNCAGCLTPIGDPPLYLGYLKGVPFIWTLHHLWEDWLLVVGMILAVFYLYDAGVQRRRTTTIAPLPTTDEAGDLMEAEVHATRRALRVRGTAGMVCLALMIAGVFLDPAVKRLSGFDGFPIGATFQIAVACAAHRLAPRDILAANDFTFGPVKEVGLLFLGIFVTMVPALGYLSAHGTELGLQSPTAFYYSTGALSAVLDNAPTYANFLQIAYGPGEITSAGLARFLSAPRAVVTLDAISTGAVFFGAMTYIGNGPNFMVKAIAESSGVVMPSFFGYLVRAIALLLPILVIHWLVFIR